MLLNEKVVVQLLPQFIHTYSNFIANNSNINNNTQINGRHECNNHSNTIYTLLDYIEFFLFFYHELSYISKSIKVKFIQKVFCTLIYVFFHIFKVFVHYLLKQY